MLKRRHLLVGTGAVAAIASFTRTAQAQDLPGTIRVIVVVPPGATMDNVARLTAEQLKDTLKRNVIVDYKVGGTGLVASGFVKNSAADGGVVMFAPLAVAAFFPFLYSKLPFDPDTDLVPVCDGVHIPHALTVSLGQNVRSLREYLNAVKADPLKGSIGTSSMSSVGALLMLRLRQLSGVESLQLVAYKGGQPLLSDLMGNQIPAGVSVISDYLAQHKAERIRILATGGARRSALAPDIPTLVESGYPDLYGVSSIGFFVRAGTPAPLVQQLSRDITGVLRTPEVRTRLLEMGAEPIGGSPEEFRQLVLSERARWEPVARAANIKVD